MTTQGHSSAPWRFIPQTGNIIALDGAIVAHVGDSVCGLEQDAKLIAAAPALLAACLYAFDRLPSDSYGPHVQCERIDPILAQLRSAIAQVGGAA